MSRYLAVLIAAAGLVLAGCSGGGDPAGPVQEHTDGMPVSSSSASAVTPTAPPEMIVEGKRYPLAYATCGQKLWDQRIDEWNRLVQERDAKGAANVVVDGKEYPDQGSYFKAKGWPASFKATLHAGVTERACPR
jgi:hypothetical protein